MAIGTGVKSDADSAAKPALRKDPFVGKYSATLKGVYCDGGFYQFKGFKIPLESGGYSSAIHNITLPVTFTKLKLNTPVSRKHSFSSSDHHIHVPVQTESYSSGSGSLKVAINWIEIGSEQGFQHGRVDTRCYNCYPWNETRSTKEIHVTFKSPYPAIPHVAVWFSDFTHEENNGERFEVKVHARATNVTTTGFVINVLEPKTEYFLEPIITWLAYPATRKDVFKGTFSTTKVGQKMFSSERGYQEFHDYGFTSPPRIFMGFDSLDIDAPNNSGLEVETVVSDVTEKGLSWCISASSNSMHSASVTYLAFA